jgi:hypothetical protein
MASLGHGISDAVRNHIPVWVDDQVVNALYTEYKNSGGVVSLPVFRTRIRLASSWVRKSRKTTTTGFERLYHCKTVQKATLIVHSPPGDMSASGYVFHIDDKPIAGGKTKLQSVQVTSAVSKKDKSSVRPYDVQFVKFSEDELRRMRMGMEYGDGFDRFEVERHA